MHITIFPKIQQSLQFLIILNKQLFVFEKFLKLVVDYQNSYISFDWLINQLIA